MESGLPAGDFLMKCRSGSDFDEVLSWPFGCSVKEDELLWSGG